MINLSAKLDRIGFDSNLKLVIVKIWFECLFVFQVLNIENIEFKEYLISNVNKFPLLCSEVQFVFIII